VWKKQRKDNGEAPMSVTIFLPAAVHFDPPIVDPINGTVGVFCPGDDRPLAKGRRQAATTWRVT